MGWQRRLSAAALVLCLASAQADELERVRGLRSSGDILALEAILAVLPVVAGSRILEVGLEEQHGLLIYEIERLEGAGQVREYRIDARTGERIRRGDE
jgi:uncharacterized membrane protein YkoI